MLPQLYRVSWLPYVRFLLCLYTSCKLYGTTSWAFLWVFFMREGAEPLPGTARDWQQCPTSGGEHRERRSEGSVGLNTHTNTSLFTPRVAGFSGEGRPAGLFKRPAPTLSLSTGSSPNVASQHGLKQGPDAEYFIKWVLCIHIFFNWQLEP